MDLIEKLVIAIGDLDGEIITKEDIEEELFMICDRVHADCHNECPIYKLRGDNKDCEYHKNGEEMFKFIKNFYTPKPRRSI